MTGADDSREAAREAVRRGAIRQSRRATEGIAQRHHYCVGKLAGWLGRGIDEQGGGDGVEW